MWRKKIWTDRGIHCRKIRYRQPKCKEEKHSAGRSPGKTDVKAPPPKKTPADGAQNEPNVSADTTGMPKSQHTSGTKSSAPPTGLLNMLLTPEQQKQYDTYMKTLSDFNL